MIRISIFIFTSLFFLSACSNKANEKNPTKELIKLKAEKETLDKKIADLEALQPKTDSVKKIPVTIDNAIYASFKNFVEVQAQITGEENVNATAQAPGIVKQLLVHAGQYVHAGQTLAILDASALEQSIQAQASQLSLLKQLYEKQQRLWAQNIGTEVQLLTAKTQYESAQKQNAALVAQKNMYRITSPISGVVDMVNIKLGDMATPGNPLSSLKIVNTQKLKAEANLGESYLGKIKTGDVVTILLPEIRDSIQTRLTYVSQAIDPISRSFAAQVRLSSGARLHPNMSCKMRINNYMNPNTIIVPINIIQRTAQGDMIYIMENGLAKSVLVKIGQTSEGKVEILAGLKAGDKIIIEGFQDLGNGTPVQAIN